MNAYTPVLSAMVAAWLAISTVGALFSARLLGAYRDTRRGVPAMRVAPWRRKLAGIWADSNIREEGMTLAKHAISLAIGLVSALFLSPHPGSQDGALYRTAVALGLVSINVLSLARSAYRWRKWNEWRAIVQAEQARRFPEVDER